MQHPVFLQVVVEADSLEEALQVATRTIMRESQVIATNVLPIHAFCSFTENGDTYAILRLPQQELLPPKPH